MINFKDHIRNQSSRSENSKVSRPIMVLAKILQFFAPGLVADFAMTLFRTPIRYPVPEREQMMDQSAHSEILNIAHIKKNIKVFSYGYSKKRVLLVHGWSGRGTQMYALSDKLLENGFMTISFDGPAHGQSTGKTTMMPEFITVCLELDKKYGPFELAVGHSMGGMAIINACTKGLRVNKIVSIGATDRMSDIIKIFIKTIGLKSSIAPRVIRKYNRRIGIDIDNYATSTAASMLDLPVFILHDSQDKEVPVSCAYEIRQNLKLGQLLVTNGLGHKRILNDPNSIKRIVAFTAE